MLSPSPSPRVSNTSSKTRKLLDKNSCFNKVKIDRQLGDLGMESPENCSEYLKKAVEKFSKTRTSQKIDELLKLSES